MIIAIDPGCTESAWLRLEDGKPVEFAKEPNAKVKTRLHFEWGLTREAPIVAIEMIASYGMPVGREVFDTCLWIGRFVEALEQRMVYAHLIYRRDVKLFHCYSARANDANVRAAILDRFGGKERAIGKKSAPGPLHGIKADVWSALAIALMVEGRAEPNAVPSRAQPVVEVPFA